MKRTKLFILLVFILTSCATQPTRPAPTPTLTLTSTLEATPTQTPLPTPTITPAPTPVGGGSGKLIFTYDKTDFINAFPDLKGETNVFVADIDGSNLIPVTNGLETYNYFKDISPDGTKVLITSASIGRNKDSTLYVTSLNSLDSKPIKIANGLPNNYWNRFAFAKWIDNTKIVYIGKGDSGFGIYKVNVDGTNPINIGIKGIAPVEILATNGTRIYWATYKNNKYYIWWSDLDNGALNPLEFNGKQIFFDSFNSAGSHFSADGTEIAWGESSEYGSKPPYYSYLHIASISDINNAYTIGVSSGFITVRWFPDGKKVLVFDEGSVAAVFQLSKPGERPSDAFMYQGASKYGIYEVSIDPNTPIRNYNIPTAKMTGGNNGPTLKLYDISPDGRQIILASYEKQDNGNSNTKLELLNLESLTFSEITGLLNTAADDYYWAPSWLP